MSKPWDKVEREPVGDKNPNELFLAVGQALTAWEMIDDRLGLLFSTLVRSRHGAAEKAYGLAGSFAIRALMVKAVVERITFRNRPDLHSEFNEIHNDVVNCSVRRNEIAHGIVTHYQDNNDDLGHYLVPAIYATKKRVYDSKLDEKIKRLKTIDEYNFVFDQLSYAYTAKQVTAYAGVFQDQRMRVSKFVHRCDEAMRVMFPEDYIPPYVNITGE